MSSSSSKQRQHFIARYYKILMDGGDIQELVSNIHGGSLSDLEWQPNGSTVLHIAATSGHARVVTSILDHRDSLVYDPNSQGDLPIHVAVRHGHLDVVKTLIDFNNQMLERENNDKNIALHIALENNHEDIAGWLFHKCPSTFYRLNAKGISPLYLAIKAHFWTLAKDMITQTCSDPVETILRFPPAKSVVHAAILARNLELVCKIHENYPKLLHSWDEQRRTTFSCASQLGFIEGVRFFLKKYPAEAFQHNEDGSFPIHKACSAGHVDIVREFLEKSPNTMGLENQKSQSILHVASLSGRAQVVKYLLVHSEIGRLINMKDVDGNTPLHLATMNKHAKVVSVLAWDHRVRLAVQNKNGHTALDLAAKCVGVPSLEERLSWLVLQYANAPASPENGMDEQKSDEGKAKKNHYKDRLNTLLMVSVLIATITFAAGFTVPGGYNSFDHPSRHQGMAALAGKHAFQVFILSNTVALYGSIFSTVTLIWAHLDDPRLCLKSLNFALPSLAISLSMMSVAFMAGLFVVLYGQCNWLAIVVLVMGCFFLLLVLAFFLPLFFPRSSFNNSYFFRYVFHLTFTFILLAYDVRDAA